MNSWRELVPLKDGYPGYFAFINLAGFTAIVISFVLPIAEALAVVAVAGCGAALIRGKLRFRPGLSGCCLIALFGLAALSVDGALDPTWAEIRINELIRITVIFVLAVLVLPWGRRPVQFAAVWFGVFLLFPVRGAFVNYFLAGYRLDGRMIWNHVWENPNDLAGIALVTAAIGLALYAVVREKRVRVLLTIGVGCCLTVIVLSGSRAVLLGAITATLTLLAYRKFDARVVMVIGGLAVVGWLFAPSGIKERVTTLAYLDDPSEVRNVDAGSMMERRRLWEGGMAIVRERPLLGVGLGSSGAAYRAWAGSSEPTGRDVFNFTYYSGRTISLHNTFLTIWTELGTIGLLLFLGFVGGVWRAIRRARHRWKSMCINPPDVLALDVLEAGFLGLLVAAFFASYDVLMHFYLFSALIVGWCRTTETRAKQRRTVRRANAVDGPAKSLRWRRRRRSVARADGPRG